MQDPNGAVLGKAVCKKAVRRKNPYSRKNATKAKGRADHARDPANLDPSDSFQVRTVYLLRAKTAIQLYAPQHRAVHIRFPGMKWLQSNYKEASIYGSQTVRFRTDRMLVHYDKTTGVMWSDQPFKFATTHDCVLSLARLDPPSSFADGWFSLPDDVKERVLKFVVCVKRNHLEGDGWLDGDAKAPYRGRIGLFFPNHILPILAAGRHSTDRTLLPIAFHSIFRFSEIARHVYYKMNVFEIKHHSLANAFALQADNKQLLRRMEFPAAMFSDSLETACGLGKWLKGCSKHLRVNLRICWHLQGYGSIFERSSNLPNEEEELDTLKAWRATAQVPRMS
jgi:hypothetical protein